MCSLSLSLSSLHPPSVYFVISRICTHDDGGARYASYLSLSSLCPLFGVSGIVHVFSESGSLDKSESNDPLQVQRKNTYRFATLTSNLCVLCVDLKWCWEPSCWPTATGANMSCVLYDADAQCMC